MTRSYVKAGRNGQRVIGNTITKEEVNALCASIVAGACTVAEAATMYSVATHTIRDWMHDRGYASIGKGNRHHGALWYDPQVNPEYRLLIEERKQTSRAEREAAAKKKAEYRRRLKEGTVQRKEPAVLPETNHVKPTVLPGIVAAIPPVMQEDEDVVRLKRAADLVAEMRQRLVEAGQALDRRDAEAVAQRASYEAVQKELADYKQMFREMKDEFIADREKHEARLEELEKEAVTLRADATYGRQQRAINHNLQLNETRKMFDERIVDASTFLHPPKK